MLWGWLPSLSVERLIHLPCRSHWQLHSAGHPQSRQTRGIVTPDRTANHGPTTREKSHGRLSRPTVPVGSAPVHSDQLDNGRDGICQRLRISWPIGDRLGQASNRITASDFHLDFFFQRKGGSDTHFDLFGCTLSNH